MAWRSALAIHGTQEIHANGAVVLAFQLYYHTTQVRATVPPGPPPCRMTACLGLVLWEILEPGLHCWAYQKGGPWREMQSAMGVRITGPGGL